MPSVIRQSATRRIVPPTQNGSAAGGVLSRIAPLAASKTSRIKMATYGFPKTGKTRLASTFPKPMLFVGSEDGTASIIGTKGIDFVQLRESSEMYELVEGPIAAGKYASVAIDNGTKLRDMRIAELWASRGGTIPERKPFLFADKAWKDVWVQSSNDMRDLLRPLLDLPNRMDLNVIVISQEQDFTAEEKPNSDLIRPAIGSALGKSVCLWLHAECDYIGQTYIREQTVERVITGAGGKEVKRMEATGKKEFCLRVGPHEIFWTGFRQQIGAPELPDSITNPTYDKIVKLIRGEKL